MFSTFPIPQRSFSFSFSQSLVLSCVVKLSVLTTPVQSPIYGKKKATILEQTEARTEVRQSSY